MATRYPVIARNEAIQDRKPYLRPACLIALLAILAAGNPPAYHIEGDAIPLSLTGQPGDPASGRAIVLAREVSTCLLCHAGPFPEPRLQGSIGPSLDGVGDRLTPGQLRLRLVNEAAMNPETLMPSFYSTTGRTRVAPQFQGKPILSAAQIEDVVAYLATLRTPMTLLPRRRLLIAAGVVTLAGTAPARATETEVAAFVKQLVGEGTLQPGRVKLDIPLLIENGNAVAMTVGVDDAPRSGPGRVASLHVFAERNPLPHVVSATFGPRSGRPRLATRIRLATSQTVIAVAKLEDGTCFGDSIELLVTLAACIE